MHQLTIRSCAWAVVPHIISVLHDMKPRRQLEYLVDVAHVELNRRTPAEASRLVEQVARAMPDDEMRDTARSVAS